MPNNIYHKRNANAGVVPTAAQLTVGEIALNTADGKAYTRTTAGNVVELTEASVADGGEQFTPLDIANLAMWLDASDTSTLYQNATGNLSAVTTPLDIPNCAAWYDASDSSTLFAADTGSTLATTTVGRWANKSGSAQVRDLLQSNASARPTLTANVFNSLPAVVFDGVDDFMQRSFTLGFPTTLFIVFAYNSAYSAANTLVDGAGAGNVLRLAAYSNTEFLLNAGGVTPQITANLNTLPITQLQIVSATADGSNSGVWRNNFLAAGQNVTGTTNTPNGLTLCSWGAFGLQYANASIAEVIVYSANLTTAQRTRVEKYLAAKWGVSAAVLTDATTAATAVSNPIGYWGDKSGNGRYAFQQTFGNRPVRGTVNGRSSISLTGSSFQALLTSVSDSLGSSIGPYTVFGVANSTAAEMNRSLMGSITTGNYDIAVYYNSNNGPTPFVNLYTTAGSRTHSSPVVATNPTVFSFAIQRTSSTAANTTFNTWQNGVRMHTQTSLGTLSSGSLRKLLETLGASRTSASTYDGAMTGNICEIAVYPQALTEAQIIALSQYANTKWGATFATFPRVSNAEAQNWINRVYTNNGTVSVSTANAVNNFCNAINAAGIRDRFYRLNLFCGDNLAACLVPLYRGQSLGGTQFGNTTDTNNNFTSSDYAERGASGGLRGNGSNKWLNPGTPLDIKPSWTTHHFGLDIRNGYPDTTVRYQMGAFFNESITSPRGWYAITGNSAIIRGDSGTRPRDGFTAASNLKIVMRASATDLRLFENTTQTSLTDVNLDTATIVPQAAFAIMASGYQNVSAGTPTTIVNGYAPGVGIARGYTIGESMDTTQHSAFVAAWLSFQAIMGRV